MTKSNKRSKPANATKRARSKRASKAAKSKRRTRQRHAPDATPADRREAAHFVETLEANRQLAHEPGPLPPGATHQVETDESGAKRVVRKRFSAL